MLKTNSMNGSAGSVQPETPEIAKTGAQILQALEIIHNPKSTNSFRQEATHFLEKVRSDQDAPYHGFALSSDHSQPAVVRHYGLSLLEHTIRYQWEVCSSEQHSGLRGWIVDLAHGVFEGDPPYISNKVAELWVEVAKRSWALDWMDMDEQLARIWENSLAGKVLVLNILETLSDDIFGHEDIVAALRGTELNRACIDIFSSAEVLRERFPNRETSMNVRYGDDGWLSRIGALLDWCIHENASTGPQRTCVTKALHTLKSVFFWVPPGALVDAHSLTRVLSCLGVSAVPVQLVGPR